MYFWRRFFLLIICFFVVIFLSTASAILAALKHVDVLNLSETGQDWVQYIPWVGDSIVQYLGPLLVLFVNLIVLVMIDIVALFERHHSHSNYQASIFIKAVIYLSINMIVVPAISIRSAESVILLLADNGYNPKKILSDLYFSDSGFFFVSLLIQQACLSSSFYVL